MKNIEVEIRSFISKGKYEELIDFFTKNGEFLNEDDQISHYFDCKEDLRILQSNSFAKIWLKKGKMHDEQREEIEIKYNRDDFEKMEHLLNAIGLNVEIKWFRKRKNFKWNDIAVTVDYTKGYGYILEFEMMPSEDEKQQSLNFLKQKLNELGVEQTPLEDFNKAFDHYKKNWKELTK